MQVVKIHLKKIPPSYLTKTETLFQKMHLKISAKCPLLLGKIYLPKPGHLHMHFWMYITNIGFEF